MTVFPSKGGGQFILAPEGIHDAICKHDGLCLQKNKHSKSPDGKMLKQRYIFQIGERVPGKDMRFEVRISFGPSMNEKSNQRPFIQKWLGKKLTDEEAGKFDSASLVGTACQISIVHSSDGYANVDAIMPLKKGTPNPPFDLEFYSKDGKRDTERWDEEHLAALEWYKASTPEDERVF